MSRRLAIMGGTGVLGISPTADASRAEVGTPYGDPSSPVLSWRSGGGTQISFIARHGLGGNIPPHRVNYRANIWALAQTRPDRLLGINVVGGISARARPGILVFPDQLIDYTWGRAHTYADGGDDPVNHVEFTEPVSAVWRKELIDVATDIGLEHQDSGTYAVTQGPRLETAAEIDRLEHDGCNIVGMTAMPEAGLARELELDYAICAVVINWAAGRGEPGTGIHAEFDRHLAGGMEQVGRLVGKL